MRRLRTPDSSDACAPPRPPAFASRPRSSPERITTGCAIGSCSAGWPASSKAGIPASRSRLSPTRAPLSRSVGALRLHRPPARASPPPDRPAPSPIQQSERGGGGVQVRGDPTRRILRAAARRVRGAHFDAVSGLVLVPVLVAVRRRCQADLGDRALGRERCGDRLGQRPADRPRCLHGPPSRRHFGDARCRGSRRRDHCRSLRRPGGSRGPPVGTPARRSNRESPARGHHS